MAKRFQNELGVWSEKVELELCFETVGSRLLIECCDPCNIFFPDDRISLPNRQVSPTFLCMPSTFRGKRLLLYPVPMTKPSRVYKSNKLLTKHMLSVSHRRKREIVHL